MKRRIGNISLLLLCLVFISCSTTGFIKDNESVDSAKPYLIASDSDFTINHNLWEVDNYVDAYHLPTDSKYVATHGSGYFSNSATTGSECLARLFVNSKGNIEITILEYGSYSVTGYNNDLYAFNVKKNGKVLSKGITRLSDRFVIENNDAYPILDEMCKGGQVVFTITGGKYSKSTYVISFDATGFAHALSELFPIVEAKEKLGSISFSMSKWHILFLGDTKKAVTDKALSLAIKEYGDGVGVSNIRYNGKWSATSLLLYFSMLGWVEEVSVTADVIK